MLHLTNQLHVRGEEREFTIQALKITLEVKMKKQAILQKAEDAPKMKKSQATKSLNNLNGSIYDKLSNRQNTFISKNEDQSFLNKTKKSKRTEELSFVTHSFLSLHNLSKQIDSINAKQDNKTSLFLTAQNNADYSSLLHSFHKKKGKESICDLNGAKQGLLPRIKQSVNKQMAKELEYLQKNNESIRRDLDAYLYKNKIFGEETERAQDNPIQQPKNEKKIDQRKKKISQIEEKIQKVKYQYAYSLLNMKG